MKENRKKKMKRIFPALLVPVVLACLFSGCTLPTTSNTTITLDEVGGIREEIVEEHENKNFTADDLQAFIEQELEAYNRGKQDPSVTLESCRVENGSVRLALNYDSCADYSAFNQVTCFGGTLQAAEDAGFSMDMAWLDPDGRKEDPQIIRERYKEWKVFIVSEPVNVKVPDKILYASDNVDVTGRLTATVKTVLYDDGVTTAAAASSSEEETPAPGREEQLHPLSTVSERYAYIIYK